MLYQSMRRLCLHHSHYDYVWPVMNACCCTTRTSLWITHSSLTYLRVCLIWDGRYLGTLDKTILRYLFSGYQIGQQARRDNPVTKSVLVINVEYTSIGRWSQSYLTKHTWTTTKFDVVVFFQLRERRTSDHTPRNICTPAQSC
jgi:hypothetical protein